MRHHDSSTVPPTPCASRFGPLARRVTIATAIVASSMVVEVAAVTPAVVQAAGTPDVSLTKDMPSEVLFGSPIPVTLTASGDSVGGTDGYNLSFNDVLPEGATFGSSDPHPTSILPQPDGTTVVVWENVADLLAGASVSLSYDFTVSDTFFSIGDTVTNSAGAFANTDPRTIPDFDPATGAATGDFTGNDTATDSTELVPFQLTKTEPSTEGELLRGVHDHKSVFTLTVDNNQLLPSTDFTIVDFLPAGLEFLGCAAVDNSTPGTFEYTGPSAGANRRIDDTAHPAMTQCATPTTVTTVTTDPDGAGPLPNDVYTRVEWNSAAIEAAIGTTFPLAATDSFFIEYAAAIPLRENIQAALTDPTANLDNNTGALTSDEQTLTNYAVTNGTTDGTGYSDDDTSQVTAEDLSIHKSVDDGTFVQGETANWTLVVESSEYHLSTDTVITVTDSIPNGLTFASSGTSLSSGPTNELDGTQTVEWELPAFTAPNQVATINFSTTALGTYRAPLSGPVAANDAWENQVSLTADATLLTDNDGSTTAGITLPDASAAGQRAEPVTILKEVAEPPAGTATCSDGSGLTFTADAGYDYRPGDRVCWRISVFFPLDLDTLSPMVQDFLPAGYTFESQAFGANHDLGTGVTYTSNAADEAAGVLTWDLADADETGDTFEVVISSIVDPSIAANNADITTNLLKFSFINTDGSLFQLRDEADARLVEEVLSLDKSVPTGPYDGTDSVPYTLTVVNDGFLDVQDLELVDTLPTGIDCSMVSSLGGATCADNGPARSTLTWTGVAVPAATEVAPTPPATEPTGTVDTPGSASRSYTVDLPDTFDPNETLTNDAAVTEYATPTNTGTPRTVTGGPIDDATIRITDATLDKTRTTSVTETGNNANRDLAIGETVTYTVTATVPAGTTIADAVVADTMPTGIRLDTASATLNGGALPVGATFSSNASGFTLTLPATYANPTGDDDFVVTVTATAENIPGNVAGVNRNNSATLNWNSGSDSASVNNRIVEPNLSIDKESDDVDDVVAPGQAVTYSIDVSNSGSTAHDLVVVDTVPADVIPLSAGVPATNGQTIDGTGGTGVWNSTARTITWNLTSLGATPTTLTYDTEINNPITSSIALTNSVVVTGTSLAGSDPDERTTYSASDDETVTAPGIDVIDKRATPSPATVGDLITYEIDVQIPADVEAYDATILDDLPAGLAFESFTGSVCAEPGPAACSPGRTITSLNLAGDTGTLGFFIGDVDPGSSQIQTITFTYTARVLDDAVNAVDAADLDNTAQAHFNLVDTVTGTPPSVPSPGDFDRSTGTETARVEIVEPTLVIDKDVVGQTGDADQRRARPGDTLAFTVAVTNTGTSPAYDVTITDTPDTLLTGYSWTPVAGVTNTDADATDGTITWLTAGPINAGATVTLTYTMTVPAGLTEADEVVAGPEATNTADVTQYFGVDGTTRAANPSVTYREYGTGAYDVTPDTVEIEVDLASIGDRVWYDIDGDGVQDPGEPGLANVDVTVTYLGVDGVPGGGDDEAVTVQTDAAGNWLVEDLPGGAYTVDVDAGDVPSGLAPSYDLDDGLTTPDGDWAGTLGDDEAKRDVDAGFDGTGVIGDTIWFDQDRDGNQNGNEGGIPGVDVTLVWAGPDGVLGTGDDITYTDTTDAAGNYEFDDLPDGLFEITADGTDLPAGMSFVSDPDAGPADGVSTTNLTALDRIDRDQDFGVAGQGTIGDSVWLDRDGDGVEEAGEPGLEGVTVTLVYAGPDGTLGTGDDETYTDVTDSNGDYLFENLPGGDYSVTVDGPLPAGSTNSGDPDGGADSTSLVTIGISPGDRDDLDQDFGYDVDSSIGDTVWWDLDRDGVLDAGEPGLGGVGIAVTYLGPDGVVGGGDDVTFTTTTAADGTWGVSEIPDGAYVVTVTGGLPAGFGPTYDDDSPADGTNTAGDGTSSLTLVGSDVDQDFGYAGDSSIGDTVWLDLDGGGTINGDEVGIADVTVTVTWLGPDGVAGGGDDVTFTRTTDDGGNYLVEGLPAGEYTVVVDESTLPNAGAGLTQTYDLVGGTGAPSNTTGVTLPASTDLDTVDFGYRGDSSIGDTVFFDRNNDGVQDTSATSSAEPGLAAIDVDVVWAGPDGIFGNGDDGTFSTTTGADGDYLVDFLPAGDYRVDVVTSSLPAGLVNTVDEDGDDDSSTPVTLGVDDDHLTADFGYFGPSSLGDFVWLDLDGDGVQDPDEPGVPNQTVRLDGPAGTLTTTTAADGSYSFTNLPDGTYTVTVVGGVADAATNTTDFDSPLGTGDSTSVVTITGGLPNTQQDFGYQGTAALGDTIWFDIDGDGIDDGVAEPRLAGVDVEVVWYGPDGTFGTADDVTIPVAATDVNGIYGATGLPSGTYRITPDATDITDGRSISVDPDDGAVADGNTPDGVAVVTLTTGTTDLDQDFGYTGSGAIGDVVWLDLDGDGVVDAGEPGIEGATVTLTWFGRDGVAGGGDDVVYTTTVADDGSYLFEHLPSGEFEVAITGLPADVVPSADPDGGDDSVARVTLTVGERDLDQDFGYVGSAGVGDTVWFDIDDDGTQTGNEPGVAGVTVRVTSAGVDGSIGTSDDLVVETTTDQNGRYGVTGLPSGPTQVAIVEATLPSDASLTVDPDGGDLSESTTVLVAGTTDLDQDFGVRGPGRIVGSVYDDRDGQGDPDPGEPGRPGVLVTITYDGPNGPVVITVPTDSDGEFDVSGLPSGGYTVEVLPVDEPANTIATGPTSVDLEVTPTDDPNDPPRADIPFVEPGSIGQRVYVDQNRNGTQDAGEPGAAGVRVILRDADGSIVAEATTDQNGDFLFPDLPPGTYSVELDPTTFPPGLRLSVDPDGTVDGVFVVTIGPGDDVRTAVFGISQPSLPTTGAAIVWLVRIATMLLVAGLIVLLVMQPRRRFDLRL